VRKIKTLVAARTGGGGGGETREEIKPWRWRAAMPSGTEEVVGGDEIPRRRRDGGRRAEARGVRVIGEEIVLLLSPFSL
jgi:hypothetical protein